MMQSGGASGEMEGWLKKKSPKAAGSSKILDSWQRRYFVLGGGELKYFKSEKAASLSNAESLKAIPISQIFGAYPNPKHTEMFLVDLGNDRKVKLQAGTERERDAWVAAIDAARRRGGGGFSGAFSPPPQINAHAMPAPRMDNSDHVSPFQQPQRAGARATRERVQVELLRANKPSKHGCCAIS
jgi:hypothetical protein